jgi:hypothetical protein
VCALASELTFLWREWYELLHIPSKSRSSLGMWQRYRCAGVAFGEYKNRVQTTTKGCSKTQVFRAFSRAQCVSGRPHQTINGLRAFIRRDRRRNAFTWSRLGRLISRGDIPER